ncbi:helix-turn-helix transcriptional regulator [Rhizobium sp. P40RR-XXII]|uniref:transcriptional regulator VisR n=1 Tax=unclassified Rhizobium TaxID=2613769 RepID=UPI001456823D|nr:MULTISPECIES: helix-turn-helix transcriptional regulator [unclassified Rhizobium]NLR86873.1 helix-turn-helix transcriptional regulator [Rhizobium sp. P28RR-XV]NLS18106.1 helix-turn-helix transcriptional regulator [Rhizobium sp. P40RR-XXII]
MRYQPDRTTDRPGESRLTRSGRISGRSDLFPKLVSMQKLIDAQHFAVYRLHGSGLPHKQRLVCELDNWGSANSVVGKSFLEAYGEAMIEHIDKSLLPLMWNGRDSDSTAETPDFAVFTQRLKPHLLPFAGVAFPVRLGAVGNGYIVFTAKFMDLASDMIVELHGRSCQIMMELLSLDERRSQAAEALSEREIACLQLAGDGRISDEIAEKLGLSVHTVNAYLGSATIKLDSVNRIQAIAKAIRFGYIS